MKKLHILFTLIAVVIPVIISAQPFPTVSNGKTLFIKNCTNCHGEDGAKGKWGAKDLRKSRLNDEALFYKISTGGWVMPAWGKILSPKELHAVADYIKTLRN